nr:hypothetical protein [Tanacetum cinerariifolium]
RRNRTLLDMVRFMMSQTTLPNSFWDYALESAARILNMVLTKKVEKTPYEDTPCPDRTCLHIDAEEHELGDLGVPANYKAAFLDPKLDKWLDVMNVEMQSMKDNKVWDLVDLPPNGKIVDRKWLFKKKTDMDGDTKRELRVSCYTNAGYLTDVDDLKSQTEYVLVAPEVGAAAVASAAGVLELDTHSSSEADTSESSPPPVFVAPMVSYFLCSDNPESDTEIPERHVSPTPHEAMLTRWRSRVALRLSSPTTSIPEIHTAPILPAPSAIVAPSSEFPLEPIALTMRKSVRPLPSHRLALRHTPPDTTDANSSTPLRFVHPSLFRTPWRSEAYLRWRSAPLSTMYPPTKSESSAGDSFSESFAGPSRKRCGSPTATVTSYIHDTRALLPSRADLLPPRKRFRDYVSPEDSVEDDIDTYVLEDIETDATTVKVAVDRDVEAGIDTCIGMEVDVGVDVEDEVKDEVESSDRGTMEHVEVGLQDIYDHVIEIPLQRIEDIEIGQRELEATSLIAGGERASILEQVASLERSNTRLRCTMMMEKARAEALAAYEATRAANALEAENQSQNDSDGDNGNGEIEMVKMEMVKMEMVEMEV